MECPNCKKEIHSVVYVQDGDSRGCEHCHVTFHKCPDGTIKYGLPGPFSCPCCRNATCPKCNKPTYPNTLTKDGSIICHQCKTTFHHCFGTIRFGSPGQTDCPFCPLKEIF